MYDVMTTAAITAELRETLLDGRIQKLGMVDALTIGAEVYAGGRRHSLVASADPQQPRLYRASSMPSFDTSVVTPFSLLMRKNVRGGVIVDIEQPPLERLVIFTIARRIPQDPPKGVVEEPDEDDGDASDDDSAGDIWGRDDVIRLRLAIEMMGRHSNLILVDAEGLVMESAKRVTPSMSRVRPILPKRVWELPPPQDKPDPRRLTAPGVEMLLGHAATTDPLQAVAVRGLRGMSPQMGREIAFTLAGSVDATVADLGEPDHQEIARQVRRLFEPMMLGGWAPHVYTRDGGVVAFAALPLAHLAERGEPEAVETISAAVERSLGGGGKSAPKDHDQIRQRLLAEVTDARARLDNRLRNLGEQQRAAEEADRHRHAGETIYAWLYMIEPGQSELVVEGEPPIRLDPALDGNANAQAYFERYRRAQRGLERVPERIREAETERDYLGQLLTQVQQSQGFNALEALGREYRDYLDESGNLGRKAQNEKKPGKRKPKSGTGGAPDSLRTPEGHLILIGRSGRQNDQVTFSVAGPDDTWLHARGVPGSHVIVRWQQPMAEDDEGTIATAAALAGWYSASRESGSVEIDVTRRRHVRKISGAGPGMVTYRNEYTIARRPEAEDALRQEGRLA